MSSEPESHIFALRITSTSPPAKERLLSGPGRHWSTASDHKHHKDRHVTIVDHERALSQQSTASASPKCLPRARLRHQCPRDYELPMSHRSTAAASQKRRFSRLRHQGPRNEERAVSHQSTAPTPQTCFTRARLRQQCPRDHERAFSHQSTAAASQKCFTRARLTTMSIPRSSSRVAR